MTRMGAQSVVSPEESRLPRGWVPLTGMAQLPAAELGRVRTVLRLGERANADRAMRAEWPAYQMPATETHRQIVLRLAGLPVAALRLTGPVDILTSLHGLHLAFAFDVAHMPLATSTPIYPGAWCVSAGATIYNLNVALATLAGIGVVSHTTPGPWDTWADLRAAIGLSS